MTTCFSLQQLGWQPYFQQQLSLEEYENTHFARVTSHHRSTYEVQTTDRLIKLPIMSSMPKMAIGDWLLLDSQYQYIRTLERQSLFKRKAAGSQINEQYVAANVDVVLIVSSLNQDFSLNRIERYLAIAHEAGVQPVVVLTKSDLCSDSARCMADVQRLDPMLLVVVTNALAPESKGILMTLCRPGQTLALLGSSGVGKSTLVNTLMSDDVQATGSIREDDSKGRHTTTSRSMHFLPNGSVLIDTPGMRELQLTDCGEGVSITFADIEAVAQSCRFADCRHQGEPGCAVIAALNSGKLDERKVVNYQKLKNEQQRNTEAIHERRARDKSFTKMVKSVTGKARHQKKGH